jgi:hypothetical protein
MTMDSPNFAISFMGLLMLSSNNYAGNGKTAKIADEAIPAPVIFRRRSVC